MRSLFLLLLSVGSLRAALPAAGVWEVRTAGAQNNGGGFKTGASGTDFSQQDAAQYALTGVTTAGADGTLLTASAATDMIGNICYIVSGTNFTAGWYEITGVSAGISITLDRNCTTAAGALGVVNVGGAFKIGGALDQDLFAALIAGNIVHIKSGTYTLGEGVSTSGTATATANIFVLGYNATRGDAPALTNRPVFACGSGNYFSSYSNWTVKHLIINGTISPPVTVGSGCTFENVKVTNPTSTAASLACSAAGTNDFINCEFVSQNGVALDFTSSSNHLLGCYVHDSDTGIRANAVSSNTYSFCLLESCKTAAFSSSSTAVYGHFNNCTFYGSQAKIGTGLLTSGATTGKLLITNSIFYGLTTGVSIGTAQQDTCVEDWNDFNNNTTDRTRIATGAHSVTTDPTFTGAAQITGTTATTSGSTLTQSGGDFSTVADNVDYVRVTSGTGVTAGIYLITGHAATTLTTNNALGTSSGGDVVYTVTTGHNFAIGTNLKALGTPGAIGTETTGYTDIGVQRQEAGGGGEHTSIK